MDFYKNVDKIRCDGFDAGLYNTVLGTQFSNEGNEPVTLEQAKLWCKIDDNDVDDEIVSALIIAARQVCEQYCNIGFISRSIIANINNADGGFNLPYGPVTSTPTAVDADGTAQDIRYNMNQLQSPVGLLTVSYIGGYATLPANLITAIKQQVIFMYENRGEGQTGLSPMAQMILSPLRRI